MKPECSFCHKMGKQLLFRSMTQAICQNCVESFSASLTDVEFRGPSKLVVCLFCEQPVSQSLCCGTGETWICKDDLQAFVASLERDDCGGSAKSTSRPIVVGPNTSYVYSQKLYCRIVKEFTDWAPMQGFKHFHSVILDEHKLPCICSSPSDLQPNQTMEAFFAGITDNRIHLVARRRVE